MAPTNGSCGKACPVTVFANNQCTGPDGGPELRFNFGHAMDATLMFSASTLPSHTPSGAAANSPSGGVHSVSGAETSQPNTPRARIFAGLMRDLLPTHERQDVAAAATSDPASLKSENLGGQLEVITTSSDQPDAGSLTAFARAQGLDESAVMALFGEKLTTMPTDAAAAAAAAAAADASTLN